MKQGKFQRTTPARHRNSGTKLGLLLLALTLIVGSTIGGTFAYLMDQTEAVTNTFTVGNVGTLTLTETDTNTSKEGEQHEYLVIPGVPIGKDPVINYSVTDASGNTIKNIDAYVFVKIDATGWTNNGFNYSISGDKVAWSVDNASWEALGNGVYYYKGGGEESRLPAKTSLTDVKIIKDNTITVSSQIKMIDFHDVAAAAGNITFTAYAIQADGFDTPAAAWAAIGNS